MINQSSIDLSDCADENGKVVLFSSKGVLMLALTLSDFEAGKARLAKKVIARKLAENGCKRKSLLGYISTLCDNHREAEAFIDSCYANGYWQDSDTFSMLNEISSG